MSSEMDTGRHRVFVTGATGYMGRHLIPALLARGHEVSALVRAGSEHRLVSGCQRVVGNALMASDYRLGEADTLVHLVGTPHPAPWKKEQFLAVDLASARACVEAASAARMPHLVYVSVAQPAPVMKAFVEVRAQAEALIRASGVNATLLRPWYVLGPGHRWPLALLPLYSVLERLAATRESARRLGLLHLREMVAALLYAVEHPVTGVNILEVPQIREIARSNALPDAQGM
jgi:uncharacterized protein YbjT (DUF2867 family)